MKGSTVFRSEKNTRFPAKRRKKKKKTGYISYIITQQG